jgi:uncharacterized protein YecA (UPF0149 family)
MITKEEIIEGLKTRLESTPREELKEISVYCVVSDKEGIGELIVGTGENILSSLAQALVDNEDMLFMTEFALNAAKEYLASKKEPKEEKKLVKTNKIVS